jgi:hypothetical protein
VRNVSYNVEIGIIEKLKRIFYHSSRMAKLVIKSDDSESDFSAAA